MSMRVFIVHTSFIDQAKSAERVRWTWCLCACTNAGNCCVIMQTDAHIILIYISPYLAPTSFGWLPSSGSSQPNSLKVTAANYSLQ